MPAAPGSGLIDAIAAAEFLTATGTPVTPGQIRVWAHRGKVARMGRDHRRRTLYRLADLEREARHARDAAAKVDGD